MDHGEIAFESNYASFNSIIASDESEMMSQWFDQNIPIQSLLNPNFSFLPSLSYEGYENSTSLMNYYASEGQNVGPYLSVSPDIQYTNQTFESCVAAHEKLGQRKRNLDVNCHDENYDETLSKKKSKPSVSRKAKNEEGKEGGTGESSSSSSEDESNGELNASYNSKKNSNGKSKTRRGNASDPQSLYARKRREKINQRLKTLQSLVPNGTKVDISTMLEEAVHYVKFLQLQIKLLSNDELWMYAPIAYNGININADLNF